MYPPFAPVAVALLQFIVSLMANAHMHPHSSLATQAVAKEALVQLRAAGGHTVAEQNIERIIALSGATNRPMREGEKVRIRNYALAAIFALQQVQVPPQDASVGYGRR